MVRWWLCFFLSWDFMLTCLRHVYEALCATRHKEDRWRWRWMFMAFILQQQDHYKVLGLEKLRHKATLGDIKKACKFVILGCNSFNQIFMSHTHVVMQGSFRRTLVWLHKCMNWWILTVRLHSWCGGVRKTFFSWIEHWIFLSLEVLFPQFISAFFYAPSFLFQVKLNSISKLASSHSSVGRSLQH